MTWPDVITVLVFLAALVWVFARVAKRMAGKVDLLHALLRKEIEDRKRESAKEPPGETRP